MSEETDPVVSDELLEDLDDRFAQLEAEDERERLAELGLAADDDTEEHKADDQAAGDEADDDKASQADTQGEAPEAEDEGTEDEGTEEGDDEEPEQEPMTAEEKLALLVKSAVDSALKQAGVTPSQASRRPSPNVSAAIREHDAKLEEIDTLVARLEENYEEADSQVARMRIQRQLDKLEARRDEITRQKEEALSNAGRYTVAANVEQTAVNMANNLAANIPGLPKLPTGFWMEMVTGLQTGDPKVLDANAQTEPARFVEHIKAMAVERGYMVPTPDAPKRPRKKITSSMPSVPSGSAKPPQGPPTAYRHTTEDLAVLRAYGVSRADIALYEAKGKRHPYLDY